MNEFWQSLSFTEIIFLKIMSLETLRTKLLADPEVKAHYDEMKPEFNIAKELILLRRRLGFTQRELAE